MATSTVHRYLLLHPPISSLQLFHQNVCIEYCDPSCFHPLSHLSILPLQLYVCCGVINIAFVLSFAAFVLSLLWYVNSLKAATSSPVLFLCFQTSVGFYVGFFQVCVGTSCMSEQLHNKHFGNFRFYKTNHHFPQNLIPFIWPNSKNLYSVV